MLDNGRQVRDSFLLPASSRRTVFTNNVPGLARHSFSMTVQASGPITAERSMYFSTKGQWWKGGHASSGADQPSTQWFIAEGHTGAMFAEYILLSNPSTTTATTATVRFLRPQGGVIAQSYVLAPASRTTIFVNDVPGLANTDVSASITSTAPIVVERSMYWPGRYANWYEGHNSLGLTKIGTTWALAEGENGGPRNVVSYVLVANPTDLPATVSLAFLRDGLDPIVVEKTVPANSRLTINSRELPLGQEQFGVLVTSTNNVPVAVERSMYWDSLTGKAWVAGTNETGTRIK